MEKTVVSVQHLIEAGVTVAIGDEAVLLGQVCRARLRYCLLDIGSGSVFGCFE